MKPVTCIRVLSPAVMNRHGQVTCPSKRRPRFSCYTLAALTAQSTIVERGVLTRDAITMTSCLALRLPLRLITYLIAAL